MINLAKNEIVSIARRIERGDRRSLSQAITFSESTRTDHRDYAKAVMEHLKQNSGKSLKIGLTGTPGVGKSTFIESFGLLLIKAGKKIAVLAIDPSSSRSGGSILGDKTRMELLSREPNAFIRPSPNGGTLGGVGRRTREAISLCEAAGYDIIIVETVGVGQSEATVSEMTDIFCLLIAPAAGDELQGVKRGIMELSDIILINKADGDLIKIANITSSDYQNAIKLFQHRERDPPNFPKVMTISSTEGRGLAKVWNEIETLVSWRQKKGFFSKIREQQKISTFKREIKNYFEQTIVNSSSVLEEIQMFEKKIKSGKITPEAAAELLFQKSFIKN